MFNLRQILQPSFEQPGTDVQVDSYIPRPPAHLQCFVVVVVVF